MTAACDMPRRVLAIASGMTPQVVTETLYALAVQAVPPFVPTEIRVITTLEGAARARAALLHPQTGQFHAFCSEYGLQGKVHFDERCIEVLAGPAGPLQDIRTPAENVLAADGITAFVRSLCADPQAAVHVSIAGGRKSMGYYLGYALSLFGRPQDRLSHVLVSAPFETHRDFYYPPKMPRLLVDGNGNTVSTAEAQVQLADIPFVRLREGMPASLVAGDASFSATVAAATRQLSPVALRFGVGPNTLVAAGQRVTLPPLLYAWYALLARAVIRGWGERGFMRYADVQPVELLSLYGDNVGRMSAEFMQLEQQLQREGGVPEAFFREKNAKVRRALKAALGLEATPYLPVSIGARPRTRHGLQLPASRITGIE
jgi:CRISPR-associated protein (TIGR02584 family)